MSGAEGAQPFVAADPAVAVVISLDELPAQPFGAGQSGGELLFAVAGRALARAVEALLRAAASILGGHRAIRAAMA